MTVTSLPVRDEYTATALQTVFNYTFKIFADGQLNVYVTPSGQEANDSTDIITTYTIDPGTIGDSVGGFITMNSGVSAGDLVTIVSNIPEARTTDYQNSGDFLPDVVDDDFDTVVSLTKQQADRAGRTLAFEESLQNAAELTLAAPEAGLYLAWNGTGTGTENVGAPGAIQPSELNGTTVQMVANASLLAGEYILTSGYSANGDFGDNVFLAQAVTGATADGGSLIKGVGNVAIEFVGLFPGGIYNVEQWGVLPGIADNSIQIQALVDFASTTETEFHFRGGVYLSGKVTIADGQSIAFNGHNSSTLKKINSLGDVLIENDDTTFVSNFILKDMTFDGNKANNSTLADLIHVFVDRCSITGCTFINNQRSAISLPHVSTFAQITGNFFRDGAEHTGSGGQGSDYVSVRTSGTRTITDGQIINIDGNNFKGFVPVTAGGGVGGVIASGLTTLSELEGHRLTITNNTFLNVGQDEPFESNKIAAINLYRRSGASIITGNRIIGGEHKAIDVQGSANCIVSNNVIRDIDSSATDAAISITNRDSGPAKLSPRCIVQGNIIENWGNGITAVQASTDPGNGILITGNYITNVLQFVHLENMIGDIGITGNIFNTSTETSSSADEQAIAIILDSTNTTPRAVNVDISGNTITDSGNDSIRLEWAAGPIAMNGNTIKNAGTNGITCNDCVGPTTINGNAFDEVANRFVSFGDDAGSLSLTGNTFDDSNGTTRSITIQNGSSDTIVNGNVFTNTPTTELINYDTQTGRNILSDNIAPVGTSTRAVGGSVITLNTDNEF